MRATKAVAALAGTVVLAGGVGLVALQQGGDMKATPQVSTTVPAIALPTIQPGATPEQITQSVLDTLTQLQQQVLPPGGGAPQPLSEEQVIAALKAQQEQLGIKVPKQ